MIDRSLMFTLLTVLKEQRALPGGTEEQALFNDVNLRATIVVTTPLIREHLQLAEDKGWATWKLDSLHARRWRLAPAGLDDIVLPLNQLEDQVKEATRLFNTFPLLVYPCRIYDRGPASGQLKAPRKDQLVPGANYAMFNDLGVYGVPGPVKAKQPFDAVHAMRAMEK